MRLFQSKTPKPEVEMVPANFAAAVIDAIGTSPEIPPADSYLDEAPEWIPLDKFPPAPSVEKLLANPNVAMVVEAAGKGGCLLAVARD